MGIQPYKVLDIWIQTTSLVASTGGSIIVPRAANFITTNIPDNQMFSTLTSNLPITIIKETCYMSTDPGYDDHKLYDLRRYWISIGVSSTEI